MATHHAPSVVYPFGRSRFHGYLLFGLWSSGSASIFLWIFGAQALDWRIFLGGATTLLAGLAAYVGWKNSPVGQLAWDGQSWRWEGLGYQAGVAEQRLSVVVDFQNLLLLRLENEAHACLWLWAERHVVPERWLDLRRAVYSPRQAMSPVRRASQQALEPTHTASVLVKASPIGSRPKS